MTFSLNDILLHTVGLIALFSPMAAIAPFIDHTAHFPRPIQRKISLKVTIYSMIFLLAGGWLGEYVLRFLGITLPALTTSGGLILLLSSIPMVMKGTNSRQKIASEDTVEDDVDNEDWKTIIFVPILFPITIGAASLSYMIVLMSHAHSLVDYLSVLIVIVLDGTVIFLTYFFAGPIGKKIGTTGNSILVRVGGIIVMALGFSVFTSGLRVLLPGLS